MRNFYSKPSAEFELDVHHDLKLLRPLYGLMFCRPDQFSRHSYVDVSSCLVVSSLPPILYTMSSHRDVCCDRVIISKADGYSPLKLSSGCDCIIEEDGESSRHDHSCE
jgi:hypothetical protein